MCGERYGGAVVSNALVLEKSTPKIAAYYYHEVHKFKG